MVGTPPYGRGPQPKASSAFHRDPFRNRMPAGAGPDATDGLQIERLRFGRLSAGGLAAILPRLNRENVHVSTMPLEAREDQDVWIEAVMAPSAVTAEEQFPVEVHVYSQFDTTSDVELKNGTDVLGSRSVPLTAG